MSAAAAPARRERPGKVAIMRAAVEVMGEDGYEGASIRDIAARAGVSVAALYYHFPSKLDLLREFLDEAYDVILARVGRRLAMAEPDPVSRLDEIVATMIASHLHDDYAQQASNVAYREHTRLHAPERAAIEEKRRQLVQIVQGVLDEGIASGDFTVDDTDEAARAILSLCASLVEPFPELRRDMRQVIPIYQRYARAIACAPPG